MENSEVISVGLVLEDSEAEAQIKDITESFEIINGLVDKIITKLSKAFAPVAGSIKNIESSITAMSNVLADATSELKSIVAMMAEAKETEELITTITLIMTAVSTFATLFSTVLQTATLLKEGDVLLVGSSAAITVLIAAIIAVVSAIVIYWDEIVLFFTETIPQLWSQFTAWIVDAIAAVGTFFVELFTNIGNFFVDCWNGIVAVWENVAQWFQDFVIQPTIEFFVNLWDSITTWATDTWNSIVDAFVNGAAWFDENVIQPLLTFFDGLWTDVTTWAQNAWTDIQESVSGIALWFDENVVQPIAGFFEDLWNDISTWAADAWAGIQEAFGSAWSWIEENIINPISNGFMDMVNGVIGFINGLIGGIINGINWIIRAINKIQFTVPDWVPGLGGMTLGFNLKELTAPQIPYLAKGAVLPANRPFLAVVGDQRHGTNVEAPLATIQEAVGLVMNDHISAMMAGFRALLEEQQATRRTIEGIEIGDRVIGEAAQRYQRKMAVTYGTF